MKAYRTVMLGEVQSSHNNEDKAHRKASKLAKKNNARAYVEAWRTVGTYGPDGKAVGDVDRDTPVRARKARVPRPSKFQAHVKKLAKAAKA